MTDLQTHLREFIETLSAIPDLGYGHLPEDLTPDEEAAYLLMVASIDEQADADRVHEIFRSLWDTMGRRLFRLRENDREELRRRIDEELAKKPPGRWIGADNVVRCLMTASTYLQGHSGGLRTAATGHDNPESLANEIANEVYRMGKDRCGTRKKVRMYLRWTVREKPDRRLFRNMHPRDLQMPLDSNIARAMTLLREVMPDNSTLQELETRNGQVSAVGSNVSVVTEFARSLFPDDPLKLDYPMFLLGRSRTRVPGDSCRVALTSCRLGGWLSCDCPARSDSGFRLDRKFSKKHGLRSRTAKHAEADKA